MTQTAGLKQAIEDAVIAGEFGPGDRLDEVSLAQRFGVSRTPVREALLQLGAEGFIDVRPRRGAVVSVLSPHRLIEMFEVMAELEAACGRLAARRLTPQNDAAVASAHDACVAAAAAGDPEVYYAVNRAFHEAIYRAARNEFLAEQTIMLHKRLSAYRRVQLRARNRMTQSLNEHLEIMKSIRAGHEDIAARQLQAHVLIQGERFSDMMLTIAAVERKPSGIQTRTRVSNAQGKSA